MRSLLLSLLLLLLTAFPVRYLKFQRPIHVPRAGQSFFAVDETVWRHARPELGDLRVRSGQGEVGYILITEQGTEQRTYRPVQLVQPSAVRNQVKFLLDMSAAEPYDHVELNLAAKDFVARAHVEGENDPRSQKWAALAENTVYDLSREHLGRDLTLRLPRSSYRYLRITLNGSVKPDQVLGAESELHETHKPVWRAVSGSTEKRQEGNDTIVSFTIPDNVPVERVSFGVAAEQPSFRRDVGSGMSRTLSSAGSRSTAST